MPQLILVLISLCLPRHDFHVSIAQVDYKDQEMQCTLRLFREDLENQLEKDLSYSLKLGEPDEHPSADSLVADYISREFNLKIGPKSLKQNYLGKEVEVEMIYLYFFYPCPEKPAELVVRNSVFFDSFDDQSNIVNVRIGDELRSAYLTSAESEKKLVF